MAIKAHVEENKLIRVGNQVFDGFHIIIPDDEQFKGTYEFTHEYDLSSAYEAIYLGDATPMERN